MVHNGIEYGIMAAYAEGLDILRGGECRREDARDRRRDDAAAQSRPLQIQPQSAGRRRGLAARQRDRLLASRPDGDGAVAKIPALAKFSGRVSDSGEGRWTIKAAIDEGVPVPVLTHGPLRAVFFARRRRLPEQAALGDALPVRRTLGKAGRQIAAATAESSERPRRFPASNFRRPCIPNEDRC